MRPYLEIAKLVWPLALGMINNAVMQFADRAYLAHDAMESLEAVLPASMLAWVFLGFFQSLVGYAGVFVSQFKGAENARGTVASYRASVLLALASGALMFACVPFGGWIFSLTASSAAMAARERAYYDIVAAGGVFLFLQMAAISYFTGLGRTRIVFWVNLLGNLLNIALDPILIFGVDFAVPFFSSRLRLPPLGLAGAAWVTVAAQAVQWIVLAVAAHRHVRAAAASASAAREPLLPLVRQILRFGIPAGGYSVLNGLSFTLFVFLTGTVGDVAFAASNACFTVNYLIYAPIEGFALGAQTLVGQSCGRGDATGAAVALRRTMALALGFVVAVTGFVLVFSTPILTLFAPEGLAARTAFLSLGRELLLIMSAWLLFDSADSVLAGALKGAGDTRFVFWWMLLAAFVFWLPLAWAVSRVANTMPALWSTFLVYVAVICAGSVLRWRGGRWRTFDLGVKRPKDA